MESLDPASCDYAVVVEKEAKEAVRAALLARGLLFAPDQALPQSSSQVMVCVRAAHVAVLAREADRVHLPKRKREDAKTHKGRVVGFSLRTASTFAGWGVLETNAVVDNDQAGDVLKRPMPPSLGDFFSVGERHHLTHSLLVDAPSHPSILSLPGVDTVFPLHDDAALKKLTSLWKTTMLSPPLDLLCAYWGAHVTYYFAFMETYCQMLLFPSVAGVLIFLLADANTSPVVPLFSLAAIVWAALFLKVWQRRAADLALRWGNLYFEDEEEDVRREFWGTTRTSPVTEKPELHYPAWRRACRQVVSGMVLLVALSIAVAIMFLSLNLQGYVTPDSMFYVASLNGLVDPDGWLTLLPTVAHAGVIYVLNQFVYRPLSEFLTSYENYKTESQFESALLLKRVAIECFDCYLPLFYICFHGKSLPQLRMELIGLFIGDVLRRVATETLLPMVVQKATKRLSQGKEEKPRTGYWPSDDFGKDEYEQFDDYLEMVVQFGYIVLFAGAFPGAAVLALLSNLVEMKSDAFKLTYLCRKPHSARAATIGGWKYVLKAFAHIAVMTNCYIFGFTSEQLASVFPMLSWKAGQARYILLIVFALEHVMFALQLLIGWLVPAEPPAVKLARERDLHYAKLASAN